MKLSRLNERDLLKAAREHPDDHITFPRSVHVRPDGALTVHRDGLQELLHRRLYRLLINSSLGRQKLTRVCDTWGCVQPHHYLMSPGLRRGSHRVCPNGHVYADTGVTESGHCAVCAGARAAVRAGHGDGVAARNARKCCCPVGHVYDAANTYRQPTASGYRRKCRQCNKAAVTARRRVLQGQA